MSKLHGCRCWRDSGPPHPHRPFPSTTLLECEADAISDGTHAFVPAVMEHIELAGVHSGDSACIIPSMNISEDNVKTIKEYTKKIAEEMHVTRSYEYAVRH